jgi:hypothetical protein
MSESERELSQRADRGAFDRLREMAKSHGHDILKIRLGRAKGLPDEELRESPAERATELEESPADEASSAPDRELGATSAEIDQMIEQLEDKGGSSGPLEAEKKKSLA